MWSEKYVWIAKYMVEMDKLVEIWRERQQKFTCFDAKQVSGVIVLTFLFFLKIHIF